FHWFYGLLVSVPSHIRARVSAGLTGSICLGPARECGKRVSLRLCTQRMQANLSAICYAIEFCIWLTAVDYDGSDPNGIRTRVTAVKGRCPRPLDDRVSERQISRRRPALQVAFVACSAIKHRTSRRPARRNFFNEC